MTTNIAQLSDIDKLTQINGVSIEEIERRARPGAYAITGFLGLKESFKERLVKDWTKVQKMGFTHIEIADHLQAIIDKVDSTGSKELSWYDVKPLSRHASGKLDSEVRRIQSLFYRALRGIATVALIAAVTYAISFVPFANLQLLLYVSEVFASAYLFRKIATHTSLVVQSFKTKGLQEDLFERIETDRDKENKVKMTSAWNAHYKIINTFTRTSIIVTPGTIDYIRKFGFYEGDEKNPYRIDPTRTISILTGNPAFERRYR